MGLSFSNVLNPLEGLVKLLINTFDDEFVTGSKSFVVMYNPSGYFQEYKNQYEKIKTTGNKESLKFKHISASSITVELLFDATGASTTSASSDSTSKAKGSKIIKLSDEVIKQKNTHDAIKKLLDELNNIKGEKHKPKFAQLIWGSLDFKGVLESAKVTHALFGSDGKPIRSKVDCTFRTHQSLKEQAAEAKKNSPDLTRFKQVKAEDNLTLISHDTYDDPKYYLELARVNRLNNFRALRNGSRLRLPPIEK